MQFTSFKQLEANSLTSGPVPGPERGVKGKKKKKKKKEKKEEKMIKIIMVVMKRTMFLIMILNRINKKR